VWQKLFTELAGHNFTILAVAFDEPEAAWPWIEVAASTYPCLIDRNHYVAGLYHMVNVPQATWIDETGRIVRPPDQHCCRGFRSIHFTFGSTTHD
jgi:peroxiredoxin